MTVPLMLSISETAEWAGVAVHAVRRWVADGSVHAVRSGNRFYVSWASVAAFLNGGEDFEVNSK